MSKKITKGILVGLGIASLTKKKIEQVIGKLVNKNVINRKQAKSLAKKVISEAKKVNLKLASVIASEIKKQAAKTKPIAKRYASRATKEGKRIAKRIAKKTEAVARDISQNL